MKRILVSGSSGLVGKKLIARLQSSNFDVIILSRDPEKCNNNNVFYWNPKENYIDPNALTNLYGVINLSGAGVAERRWTKQRKKTIVNSRVSATATLVKAILSLEAKPAIFINASATGYYGTELGNKIYTEEDNSGNDFLAQCCLKWESELSVLNNHGIRTVVLRIGVVLSKDGGALKKITTPVKFGLTCILGSGKQYVPWIHIDDLCSAIYYVIQNDKIIGPLNLVSDEMATNALLTKTIAKKMKKKSVVVHIPGFVLKIVFGEMATMILYGNNVSNGKLIASGFKFQYNTLEKALDNLL